MSELSKKKITTLRKMAEEQGVEDWENLDREALLAALGDEPEDVDLDELEDEFSENDLDEADFVEEAVAPAPKRTEAFKEDHVPVGSKAEIMKLTLSKQPKVRILIPLEGGEKLGVTELVCLNGYRLNIPKGVYVEVPQQVADVIMESQKQTQVALDHEKKINGNETQLN